MARIKYALFSALLYLLRITIQNEFHKIRFGKEIKMSMFSNVLQSIGTVFSNQLEEKQDAPRQDAF